MWMENFKKRDAIFLHNMVCAKQLRRTASETHVARNSNRTPIRRDSGLL
jgi:hypothetical protein